MRELTIAPLSSRILRRLPGSRSLEDFATESVVVCDAEDQPMRPAVFPSGELDRITGVHEFSAGLNDELHLTTRDHVHHTPTIARRLRNITLASGLICNHRSYEQLTFKKLPFRAAQVEVTDTTAALCSTAGGNDYFAHFLLDDAATALLGTEFGQVTFSGAQQPPTLQMREYLSYFGVPYNQRQQAKFRDIWLFTDHPHNRHRRKRMQHLRDRLREKFTSTDNRMPIYIRRGNSGSRRILENEAEIESLLAARGFGIVDPETMSTHEICRLLNNSPLAVGVEGSQLVHGVLNLRPQGALLCIQPAARFNAVFRGYCNSLDLNWGFVVAAGGADRFRLSTKRLLQTIDELLERS